MKLTKSEKRFLNHISGNDERDMRYDKAYAASIYRKDGKLRPPMAKARESLLRKGLLAESYGKTYMTPEAINCIGHYHYGNNCANQSIKGKLVGREVYYCQSCLVEELFKAGLIDYEQIENCWSYRADLSDGEWEGSDEERTEKLEELQDEIDDLNSKLDHCHGAVANRLQEKIDRLQDDYDTLDRVDSEMAEIYEWWLVSDWFAEELKAKGQCILEEMDCTWWGRQTTGQAILLDSVITSIAIDMRILKGMENGWND